MKLPAGKWAVPAVVVAAIVAAAPSDRDDVVTAAGKAGRIQTVAPAPARAAPPESAGVEEVRLAQPEQEREPEAAAEIGNIFGVTSWYVPPPPPPPEPPPPPPVPTAPPLPFTYLGRYEDAPRQLTILVKGERMYTVAAGDVIDDTYRVDRVVPGTVELTYLPLNIKQMLSTGEAL